MLYLILSILLSSCLFVLFKYFGKKGIHLLSAIIGNYIACIAIGGVSAFKAGISTYNLPVSLLHLALGCLFFGTFYLMGKSSQRNGVGITGMAGKMSLLITVTLLSVSSGTTIGMIEILALILGLTALILMSLNESMIFSLDTLKMPFLIFLGSGIIDTCLAWLKNYQMKWQLDQSFGIVLIFSGALLLAAFTVWRSREQSLDSKGLAYGLLLGTINYYSVHFLMEGIGHIGRMSINVFYMINNIGVVVITFLAGIFLFRESTKAKNLVGLMLAILSIYLVLEF